MSDAVKRVQVALADRYRVLRELGAGGMATVYLAEDLRHDRQVAIKVLRPDLAASLGPDRFLREVKIAANLQHPHILPLYDSGEADGLLYYVMPYIEGTSLRQKLLREVELPISEAIRILRDLADAIAHAHQHGVVHRDIKPENVMLSGRHALVMDFGVAKAVSEATVGQSLTTAGMALGTPAYMAPEQATADPHTDHRADIYALGVIAYELLTGVQPVTGGSAQAILTGHVTAKVEPISKHRASIPPALAAAVMKCLEKRPADRWQSADEVLAQLETVLTPSGELTPAGTSGLVKAAQGMSGRKLGTIVLALVLLTVVGVLLLLRQRKAAGPNADVLAVLPFANMGPAEDDYFADGMTEEITSRLARVSGLAVIASGSTNQYKGTTKSPQEVASELQAGYLLRGTVRWEKNPSGPGRIRVTPQLIRSKDGVQVWAELYEESYGTGMFKIQAAIAEKVAEALRVTILATERKAVDAIPTSNLEAHDLYLRGRDYLNRRASGAWGEVQVALTLFQRAVAQDSNFALAWAWLGIAHRWMSLSGGDQSLPSGMPRAERYREASKAVRRALSIDPELTEAHAANGWLLFDNGDSAAARQELDIAYRDLPNDPALLANSAWDLRYRGRYDEAGSRFARAVQLDPRSILTINQSATGLWHLGRIDEAGRLLDRLTTLNPDDPSAYSLRAWFYLATGNQARAGEVLRTGIERAGPAQLVFAIAQNSVHYRMLRIYDQELGPITRELEQAAFGLDTADFLLAKAIVLKGEPGRAHAYWDALATQMAGRMRADPNEPIYRLILGMALANSGKTAAALGTVAQISHTTTNLALELGYLAEVLVAANEAEQAITALEKWRQADPTQVTPHLLRADPVWLPLRDHPRFKAILTEP